MRVATLPSRLQVVPGVQTERFGPDTDGGYSVPTDALGSVDWIVGLGLADDWRFEQALRQATGAPVTVLDHTVTGRYWVEHELRAVARVLLRRGADTPRAGSYLGYRRFFADPACEHRRVAIGSGADGTVSLPELLSERPSDRVFLKCDVEGDEWRILDDIVACSGRLVAAIIEFHNVDLLLDRLLGFLDQVPAFVVVAVAANNYQGVAPDGTPRVVEITLARRELLTLRDGLPAPQARSNNPRRPPIQLTFKDQA